MDEVCLAGTWGSKHRIFRGFEKKKSGFTIACCCKGFGFLHLHYITYLIRFSLKTMVSLCMHQIMRKKEEGRKPINGECKKKVPLEYVHTYLNESLLYMYMCTCIYSTESEFLIIYYIYNYRYIDRYMLLTDLYQS